MPKSEIDEKNEANFTEDVKRIGKELLRAVNPKLAGNQKFELLDHENGCGLKRVDPISLRYMDKIEILTNYNYNVKKNVLSLSPIPSQFRYRIHCSIVLSHRPSAFKINVSDGDICTQKEIENAKKIIIKKVLEQLNMPYG